jgi:hypothetical protein
VPHVVAPQQRDRLGELAAREHLAEKKKERKGSKSDGRQRGEGRLRDEFFPSQIDKGGGGSEIKKQSGVGLRNQSNKNKAS